MKLSEYLAGAEPEHLAEVRWFCEDFFDDHTRPVVTEYRATFHLLAPSCPDHDCNTWVIERREVFASPDSGGWKSLFTRHGWSGLFDWKGRLTRYDTKFEVVTVVLVKLNAVRNRYTELVRSIDEQIEQFEYILEETQ